MAAEKWSGILEKYNKYIKSNIRKAQELQKTDKIYYIKKVNKVVGNNVNHSCLQDKDLSCLKKHKFNLSYKQQVLQRHSESSNHKPSMKQFSKNNLSSGITFIIN